MRKRWLIAAGLVFVSLLASAWRILLMPTYENHPQICRFLTEQQFMETFTADELRLDAPLPNSIPVEFFINFPFAFPDDALLDISTMNGDVGDSTVHLGTVSSSRRVKVMLPRGRDEWPFHWYVSMVVIIPSARAYCIWEQENLLEFADENHPTRFDVDLLLKPVVLDDGEERDIVFRPR